MLRVLVLLLLLVAAAAVAAAWTVAPLDLPAQLGVTAGVSGLYGVVLVLRGRRRRRARSLGATIALGNHKDDAVLAELGIERGDGELKAACIQIARRIHNGGVRVIGFVPAENGAAVPPVLIQLGVALTELTGATIAVVDANVRYPGLAGLTRDQATDFEDSVFSTRWLYGSLALLSPPHVERAGQVVPQLAQLLLDGSDLFEHVLVDLTGFELLGEHASAAACMDAVALVGRAHHTHERELIELARLMPSARFLGVLLVG